MSDRTQISISVPNGRLEEVLDALRSLTPDVGPHVVTRPGATTDVGVAASFPGDVRDAVHESLEPLGLEYNVGLGELEDH